MSDKGSSNSEKEENEDEEEELPEFKKKYSSKTVIFLSKIKLQYKIKDQWNGTAIATTCKKYTIFVKEGLNVMIGFSPKKIDLNGNNHNKIGYSFSPYHGSLFSATLYDKKYSPPNVNSVKGSKFGCKLKK
jgi:hypothetical protein